MRSYLTPEQQQKVDMYFHNLRSVQTYAERERAVREAAEKAYPYDERLRDEQRDLNERVRLHNGGW